jgi:hypothetical protein
VNEVEFLHTLTPAESDALEDVRGPVVPISRRLREAEARGRDG